MRHGIPVLDMSCFGQTSAGDLALAHELGRIFRQIGFVSITGHGVSSGLIADAFEVVRSVFMTQMTLAQRMKYEFRNEGCQMGFTPPVTEISKGHSKPNCMQFWHVNDPEGPIRNEFPIEVPSFGQVMLVLHATLKRFGAQMLRAIAMDLERDPEFFIPWIQTGANLLRAIHYPALDGTENVERSGAHEDINLITILVPATEPGLQVLTHEGNWLDANNPPGSLIVNLGDMLKLHTFGKWPSTTHRVVNPGRCPDRFSMPMFIHPRRDQPLVTAGAYTHHRLREINLLDPLSGNQIDF